MEGSDHEMSSRHLSFRHLLASKRAYPGVR